MIGPLYISEIIADVMGPVAQPILRFMVRQLDQGTEERPPTCNCPLLGVTSEKDFADQQEYARKGRL